MNNSDGPFYFFMGALVGILLGMVMVSIVDVSFEREACDKLETTLQVNLEYAYREGCHVVGSTYGK